MADTVLRLPAVTRKTGLSRSAIYNRVADGSFPRSLSLGGRSRGWLESEIDAWIRACAQSREGEQRSPAVQLT
jgi:prophage regulatory protein